MTCSFDLKEYALGECPRDVAGRLEAHLAQCGACREELARLQLTQATLMALREEEIPRRIAFVSDRVFEPRWYRRIWNSGPQLGFVAASLLAAAILVHAFTGIATPPPPREVAAQNSQAVEEQVRREVSARLDSAVESAVAKAVAASEERQQRKTVELLRAAEQRFELDRRATLEAVAEQTRILQKQVNNMYVVAQNMRTSE
jgi:anti-sigma factor RsiW